MLFNNLPIIIKSYNIDMPENVDYVEVKPDGGNAWIPSVFNITISCIIQNIPNRWRSQFNLDSFRDGSLLKSGGWF
jgi:hypothetical protein